MAYKRENILEHIQKEENLKREMNNIRMKAKIDDTIQRTKEQERRVVEEKVEEPEEPLNSDDDDDGQFIRCIKSGSDTERFVGLLGQVGTEEGSTQVKFQTLLVARG